MMIVKDCDGDLWEEISPNGFECRTGTAAGEVNDLDGIKESYGPVTVFNGKPQDTSVYRVTRELGTVRHYGRRGLASALSNPFREHNFIKVERVSEPAWEDVTTEFLGDAA